MKNETAIVPSPEATAELIPQPTAKLIEKSFAENTVRNRQQALKHFDEWLKEQPCSDGLLAQYITHLFDQGKAPGTISIVVSAVKWLLKHRNNGTSVDLPITSATLSGIRREGRDRGRGQRNGLTWKEVGKDMCGSRGRRHAPRTPQFCDTPCYVRRVTAHFGSNGTSHRRPRGQHTSDPVLQDRPRGFGRTPIPLRRHPPDSRKMAGTVGIVGRLSVSAYDCPRGQPLSRQRDR